MYPRLCALDFLPQRFDLAQQERRLHRRTGLAFPSHTSLLTQLRVLKRDLVQFGFERAVSRRGASERHPVLSGDHFALTRLDRRDDRALLA